MAEPLIISQSLQKAKAGDYVVSAQGKNLTLFHIFDRQENRLIVEEISAPLNLKKTISSWQSWINNGAPGHLAWVMYELDLESKKVEDMYSFSQMSWQKIYQQEQIFPTLIGLKFEPIKEGLRKKAGPRPPIDIPDTRSIWNPPIYHNGKRLKNVFCQAYQAYWPNDATELAGKKIEIFFPQDNLKVPHYFPFWIQVSNQFAQAKMRVIDSGNQLQSIHSQFPTPPLEFISHHYTPEGHLQFDLKTHPSYEGYNLYFREANKEETLKQISFISKTHASCRKIRFTILNKDLNNNLDTDRLYYFIFEPQDKKYMSIETSQPIGLAKLYVH